MSQVRKFQSGGSTTTSTPEEQKKKYPKLYIDSTEIEMDDDAMQALDSYFRTFDPKYRQFFGDITNTLRSGKDVSINTHTNNISGIDRFSALNERQNHRAFKDPGRNRAGKFFDALTDSPINQLAEAIYYAGGFRYNKGAAKPNAVELNKYRNEENMFDWDKNGDTYIYSSNPKNNFLEKRLYNYLDYLKDRDTWKKANEWSDKITDEDILVDWYTRNGQDAAKQSIDALLGRIRKSSGWDSLSESDQELLNYFNIRPSKNNTAVDTTPAISSNRDKDGNYDPNARSSTGAYMIWKGDPKANAQEDPNGWYTNLGFNDFYHKDIPYLITESDWSTLGLNGEFEPLRNSILYNGRFYTPDDLAKIPDSDLAKIMAQVQSLNTRNDLPGNERWTRQGQLVDWYGENNGPHYYDYNSKNDYIKDRKLRELLKDKNNLSFWDASSQWGLEPGKLLGFYDYSQPGTGAWGFRNPYFITFDEDGNGQILTEDQIASVYPNNVRDKYIEWNEFDPNPWFGGWYLDSTDGQRYGIAMDIPNENGGENYKLLEGPDGKFYILDAHNERSLVSDELLEYILSGKAINREEAKKGELSNQHRNNTQRKSGSLTYQPRMSGNPVTDAMAEAAKAGVLRRKEGGDIPKGQIGMVIPAYKPLEEPEKFENPLQKAGYIRRGGENQDQFDFSTLNDTDRKDLWAAALDLSGAIAGLVPGGSAVGAGLGLTSTALMTKADIERGAYDKGILSKEGLRSMGSAVSALLLDAASIIPYVGEGPKMFKVAKSIAKIGKFVSPILNAAGLTAAVKAITKPPKEWTTEDVIAVSAGIQAVLNMGHTAHTGFGEQKLARQISAIKQNVGTNANTSHVLNMKVTNDSPHFVQGKEKVPITLSNDEIRAVLDAKKDAGAELTRILKNNHKVDPNDINTDSKKLLESFGFEASTTGWRIKKENRNVLTGVSEKKQKTDKIPNYHKMGFLTDLIVPWHANRRSNFIDANITDPKIRKAIADQIYTRQINETTRGLGEEFSNSRAYRKALGAAYARNAETNPELNKLFTVEGRNRIFGGKTIFDKEIPLYTRYVVNPEITVSERAATNSAQQPLLALPYGGKRRYFKPAITGMDNDINYREVTERGLVPQGQTVTGGSDVTYRYRKDAPSVEERQYPRRLTVGSGKIVETPDVIEQPFYGKRNYLSPASTIQNPIESTGTYSPNDVRPIDMIDVSKLRNSSQNTREALQLEHKRSVEAETKKPKKKAANQRRAKDKQLEREQVKNAETAKILRKLAKSDQPIKELHKILTDKKDFTKFLRENRVELVNRGILSEKKGGVIYAENGLSTTGWNVDNPSKLVKYLPQVLSEIGYLKTNKYQNDYLTKKLEAAEAARVHSSAPTLNGIRTTNPVLERVKEEINDERTRGSRTPVTNDAITNYAIKKDTDAQLLNRENQINTQLSQDYTAKEQYNNEIQNKNILAAIQTANENKKVDAAVDSAKKNEEAANIIRKDQSSQNKRLEWQNLIQQDLDRAKTYATNLEQERITKQFDADLYNLFNNGKSSTGENLRTLWSKLPYDERLQYTDFADWVSKKHADIYDASVYEDYLTRRNDALKRAAYKYALTIPAIGKAYISSPVPTLDKKGGRLNGKTRYTLEPDERIWVDNNKAAHAAIAKLNDNTIKLILRALK